jgi:hypothetical protein
MYKKKKKLEKLQKNLRLQKKLKLKLKKQKKIHHHSPLPQLLRCLQTHILSLPSLSQRRHHHRRHPSQCRHHLRPSQIVGWVALIQQVMN